MKIPYLKKIPELKSCHDVTWEDNYSWIHQKNILEVLRDKNKLLPEVKAYLEEENKYSNHHLEDTKPLQKKLFDEIKGRIKLDDESLPYKDHTYEYWTKTTKTGNYSIKLRKKISSDIIEESKIKGDFDTTNVWNIDPSSDRTHSAVFPEILCEKVIKYYSYKNDLIFDGNDDEMITIQFNS